MRIGEIDGDAGDGRQALVTRHPFSLIVGQRFAHQHVHAIEDASEARERGLGGCSLHASEQTQAARALDQGANRGLIARTLVAAKDSLKLASAALFEVPLSGYARF